MEDNCVVRNCGYDIALIILHVLKLALHI